MGFTKHFNRRQFMKLGASLGVSAVGTHLLPRSAGAASGGASWFKASAGFAHPYAYSGGGINGIWLHIIEPLM